jgi:uncharacterized integral membrane protein
VPREQEVDAGSQTGEIAPKSSRRERSPARVIAALVVVAVVVVFVIENHENVKLRFWFVTGHVHLVWLMLVCVVLGGLAEFMVRRVVRMRVRSRFSRLRRHEP